MTIQDFIFIIQWWFVFLIIGIIFLPLTVRIFSNFFDRGYIFSKIIGIAAISYAVFVLGFLKIFPFTEATIFLVSGIFLLINIFLFVKVPPLQRWNLLKGTWKIFVFEETIFLSILIFWSFIHAHAPDIHGLEKYMDYGFINSILRSVYFPPLDMWLTPLLINYYYFGHLVTAVLTKLSALPSFTTYNLMLSTISALTFAASFSIGANLMHLCVILSKRSASKDPMNYKKTLVVLISGLLTGFIVSFAGNLHAIYTFFKPYVNENPVPFWQLLFSPNTFPNSYWYPNATRFIHNTIHEFPIYSSVVSDLHGHVLDIPFVLFTIALLLSMFYRSSNNTKLIQNSKFKIQNYSSKFKIFNFRLPLFTFNFSLLTLLAFMLAIMYMTNAWDGIIYFLLTAIVIFFIQLKSAANSYRIESIKYYVLSIMQNKKYILHTTYCILPIFIVFFVFSLPFSINFKPFASGIGILCAPEFLTKLGKVGPFLLEADHCQHSPFWQLMILYGFFYFWVTSFFVFLSRVVVLSRHKLGEGSLKILRFAQNDILKSDMFILILIAISTLLIIIPEVIYIKDIYPAHYRANTMFKLVYQAFIMLSISSGYIIIRLVSSIKYYVLSTTKKIFYILYFILATLYLILVFIYPYFAINSYFGDLKTYHGLDGTKYLKALFPTDYEAILWINKNIKGQPVILEAQGDSYTDFARVSSNTGLPTVLGWSVHEWLWRGTYDVPSPRIPEVQSLYESENIEDAKKLIDKYKIELVFLGDLERQKYPNLNEQKFKSLGKIIYENGDTKIYQLDSALK